MRKPQSRTSVVPLKLPKPTIDGAVVVGIFGGCLVGFIFAIALGILKFQESNEIPAWVQAAAAVVATVISAYAVYLVAKTLSSTREALSITQNMAEDQRRIAEVQTRPYLVLEDCHTEDQDADTALKFSLKNFGVTPAVAITVLIDLEVQELMEVDEGEGVFLNVSENEYPKWTRTAIPPQGTLGVFLPLKIEDYDPKLFYYGNINWSYYSFDRAEKYKGWASFSLLTNTESEGPMIIIGNLNGG